MKSIRVVVLLLLASVHISTQVPSDESVPDAPAVKQPTIQPAKSPAPQTESKEAAAAPNTAAPAAPAAPATPAAPVAPVAPATPATPAAPAAPAAPVAPATPAAPTAAQATPRVPQNADNTTPDKTPKPSGPTVKPNVPALAPTDRQIATMAPSAVTQPGNETTKTGALDPRSPHPSNTGNSSETVNESTETRGLDESTEKPKQGTPTVASAPRQTVPPPGATQRDSAGSMTGSDEKTPPKSDKRLWWIVLPVLLVIAAAIIMLKFKCKKVHDHTETIDTGTENASFQSRPESTKDGVMLLGVKSSGGEENAAAR